MKLFTAAALAAAALSPASAQPQPATAPAPVASPQDWRATAVRDVLAAYDIYAENHPGMHDRGNPAFAAQLKRARDEAMAVAEKAMTRDDYSRALALFTAGLSDGHAVVYAKSPPATAPATLEWPGFIAAWRGDHMVVTQAEEGASALAGAAIVSCDGRPVRDVVLERMRTRGLRPNEAGHWWARAAQAFTSSAASRARRPERCDFRTPQGLLTMPLSWAPAPADLSAKLRRASDGEKTPIGLSEPRPGLFLVGLPDFQPDEAGVKAYRALFATLRERAADLRRARAVVLDLRYNNGGSSYWSKETAKALWGDALVERTMDDYFRNVSIWWRASRGNTDYIADMEAQMRRNGDTKGAEDIRKVGEGMKASLARGDFYFVERDEEAPKQGGKPAASAFRTPVYVITPGGCASACLDAIDVFKRFANVKLIGAPTSADSTYMDVRVTDLPSGEGRIVIPNKMWVGRPRKSGEVYRPDILVADADWSTAVFLDRIERDLKR